MAASSFQSCGKQSRQHKVLSEPLSIIPHVYINVSYHAHHQIQRRRLLPVSSFICLHQRTGIMPTLYGKKTTVQLSVSDLRRATTPNPRTQQSPTTSASIRDIAQQFARDSIDGTLSETPLYTEEGSHVRFLGNNKDMLFYMVHAGKNFFDLTTTEQRNTRPARVPLVRKKSAGTTVVLDGEKIGVGTSKDGKTPRL